PVKLSGPCQVLNGENVHRVDDHFAVHLSLLYEERQLSRPSNGSTFSREAASAATLCWTAFVHDCHLSTWSRRSIQPRRHPQQSSEHDHNACRQHEKY